MRNITPICVDCEFTGLHRDTTLISIGLCSYDGIHFYAEFMDYDKSQLDDWIRINVIGNLMYNDRDDFMAVEHTAISGNRYSLNMKGSSTQIVDNMLKWLYNEYKCNGNRVIQFYGDCSSYDIVLLNDLLSPTGFSIDLPEFISYIPIDLCTLLDSHYIDPDISREKYALDQFLPDDILALINNMDKHNSLYDAIIIALCFNKLGYRRRE